MADLKSNAFEKGEFESNEFESNEFEKLCGLEAGFECIGV